MENKRSYGNNILPSYESDSQTIGNNGFFQGDTDNSEPASLEMTFVYPVIKQINKAISMKDVQQLSMATNIPVGIVFLIISGKAVVPEIIAELFTENILSLGIVKEFDKEWISENTSELYEKRSTPTGDVRTYGSLVRNKNYRLILRYPVSYLQSGDMVEIKDIGWMEVNNVINKEDGSITIYSGMDCICEAHGNEEIICFKKKFNEENPDKDDLREDNSIGSLLLSKMAENRESESVESLMPHESEELRRIWKNLTG